MAVTIVNEDLIIDANQAYTHMTGYPREQLIGHTTIERGIWRDLRQRDRAILDLQAKGEIHDLEVDMFSQTDGLRRVIHPDGSIRHIWDRGFLSGMKQDASNDI